MANVVAYLDLALEIITGLDPNEDARDLFDIVEKKIAFSLGTRPADADDEQDAYDNRQKILHVVDVNPPMSARQSVI